MRAICRAYRAHDIPTARLHARVLKLTADAAVNDKTIRFAADEAVLILRQMGDTGIL